MTRGVPALAVALVALLRSRGILALALAALLAPPGTVARAAGPELPLGSPSLGERRASAELAPGVRWTRIVRAGGPWRVNVLTLAPSARVLVAPAGSRVGARERPSALARRLGGVASVNGGYFAGDGNPAGVLASGGRLLSEPVGGRTALLLGGERALAALRFAGEVDVGGHARLLDGVNRPPGLVPACGGRGGDRPTELPDATTTCTDPSELVAFTPEWGRSTPVGGAARLLRPSGVDPRVEALVRAGRVTALRSGGGAAVPGDGFVLSGTGDAARLLRRFALPGAPVTLDTALRTAHAAVGPESLSSIVGGGPRLLAHGRVRVRARAEGFAPLSAPWFYGSFVAARHPRTLAGVRRDRTLLLVTVDGRRPGWSAGVTLPEAARLMRALGATEALNLDGGGSSSMTVRGRVVSRPSDASGERPVSDGLVALP